MPADTRHFTPVYRPWDAREADAAIKAIVDDTLAHLDRERLWPVHPSDDGVADGHGSLYFGAAGVIWALWKLGVPDEAVNGG
ncbi:hypothetical protein [Methylobacterium sp. D54C]